MKIIPILNKHDYKIEFEKVHIYLSIYLSISVCSYQSIYLSMLVGR